MRKKIINTIKLIIILLAIFCVFNIIINKNIFVREYIIQSKKITEKFNNYKILQITDVHSIRNEIELEKIINKIKNQNPNIICVTGDLIDAEYYCSQNDLYNNKEIKQIEELTIKFMKELKKIADTYYIYGNHEMMLLDDPENNKFKKDLEKIGIEILNNKTQILESDGEKINLIGVQDPATLYKHEKYAYIEGNNKNKVEVVLNDLFLEISEEDKNNFTILLSHRPEYFELYDKYSIDLALTGHTHGGIAKLPIIKGIYAHPQGWLPKYSYGRYETSDFSMIISGGVGYSKLPIRIFNPPEICVVTLKDK
ncbi:MAG: metallophosphoesterase [Clostridia bacterium]|nr:metallophosphoesterase [Clostridia bacterium]